MVARDVGGGGPCVMTCCHLCKIICTCLGTVESKDTKQSNIILKYSEACACLCMVTAVYASSLLRHHPGSV